MNRRIAIGVLLLAAGLSQSFCMGQVRHKSGIYKSLPGQEANPLFDQFLATSNLLDAAINSINSINSLVKKENYRNKISSFNNPATSDIGFTLEKEISLAIQPILDKTRKTNTKKLSQIVSSLIHPVKNKLPENIFSAGTVFNSLISLVGNLAIHEKKVTHQDVDSFLFSISKYFAHYEKLKLANLVFDDNINKFNRKLQELQFDTREFMLDIVLILYPDQDRKLLKLKNLEEILLKYLAKEKLDTVFSNKDSIVIKKKRYPGDAIKTTKEIVYGIQKLFQEYQTIYFQNYNEIRFILLQTKDLGKEINLKQVDHAVQELDQLYQESKEADVLNLRLNTLAERLKYLVSIENLN